MIDSCLFRKYTCSLLELYLAYIEHAKLRNMANRTIIYPLGLLTNMI